MSPEQFREHLEALGLKQTGSNGASQFFDVNDSTIRRWASGAIPIPSAYAMLLRLMMTHRLKPAHVKTKYGSD